MVVVVVVVVVVVGAVVGVGCVVTVVTLGAGSTVARSITMTDSVPAVAERAVLAT